MNKRDAIKELKGLVNGGGHAVLCRKGRSWYTEYHAGSYGNCGCVDSPEHIWSETGPYTDPADIQYEVDRQIAHAY